MTTTTTSFEQPRMDIGRDVPPLHRALVVLGNEVALNPRLRELVNLRVSILNGCAYCIDMHTKNARRGDRRGFPVRCGADRAQGMRNCCPSIMASHGLCPA